LTWFHSCTSGHFQRKVEQNGRFIAVPVDIFKERLNKMDIMDLEANPEEKETVAERQEVPKEEAENCWSTVAAAWGPASSCRVPVTAAQTDQGDGGFQQLAVARRGMTCCVIPAWRKGQYCHGQGRTRLYQEPRKDGNLVRDVGQNWKASME
jgi:hypothetical protein